MFNKFLALIDFLFGLFFMYAFVYNYYNKPIYGILMIMSVFLIILHIYTFLLHRKEKKNTIIDLNGIISGLLLFLNPNLGAIIASINYILISIFKTFRLS